MAWQLFTHQLIRVGRVDYTSHNFTIDWHTALWFCCCFFKVLCNEDAWRRGVKPESFKMKGACKSRGDLFMARQRNFSHDKEQIGEGRSMGSSALGKMKFFICIILFKAESLAVFIQHCWLRGEEVNLLWGQWWCGTEQQTCTDTFLERLPQVF